MTYRTELANYNETGMHNCMSSGCDNKVSYDDEPYCFGHSPDSGSSVPGFSFREMLESLVGEDECVDDVVASGCGCRSGDCQLCNPDEVVF